MTSLVNPDFFQDCLTVGTVSVTAGIVVKLHVAAVGTLADVTTETA